MSNQLKPYTIDDYEKFLSENLGYDKNLPMTICMDTCEYFKDRDTIIDEAELVEWICDRLKEENLIGFTTDFIIAKLIEEELLEVISMGHKPDELSELLHAIYPISDILVPKAGIEPVYRTFKFKQNKQN